MKIPSEQILSSYSKNKSVNFNNTLSFNWHFGMQYFKREGGKLLLVFLLKWIVFLRVHLLRDCKVLAWQVGTLISKKFWSYIWIFKSFYSLQQRYFFVDTFFQNEWIIVNSCVHFWWLLVDIFCSRVLLGWIFVNIIWVNSSRHFLIVPTQLISQPMGCGVKPLLG